MSTSRKCPVPKTPKAPVSEKRRAASRKNIVEFNTANASKQAMKHGATSPDTMAGKLPKGFEDLQGVVDGFYEGWVADAGGRENITKAKEALLWVARGCLAVFAVGLEHVKANGMTDAEGNVQPVLKIIGTYANTMRLNLISAGLERTPRNVTRTLEATLQEIAEKEHTEEPVADENR
jgi:hypothetical protein